MRRSAAIIASAGLVATGVVAITATPAVAAPDTPLSANRSSMWQTNGDVDSLAVGNGILYAAGRFTRVRPPGAAAGTSETTRTYVAAFNASTGALITGFNVTLNGRVRSVRLAANGARLYIGGDFTTVGGQTRQRLAAVNPTTGALDTTFVANANASVTSIATSSAAVFVSGNFTTIKNVARTRIASLNPTNGNVNTAFAATLDSYPRASVVSPDGSTLLTGGTFALVNGVTQPAIASLNTTTGALQPWGATGVVARRAAGGGCDSEVSEIAISGARAYVVAEGLEPGCFEGAYAANLSDGALQWDAQCLGASQAAAVIGNFLYRGSHMHDCGRTPGGFVGPRNPDEFIWYRLEAHSTSDGTFAHWSPNTNGAGSDHVGPHAMTTDGTQLFVGGDFSSVGGAAQQGLTRFAPNGGNSTPSTPLAATATASAANTVTVVARGVPDNNNGMLTYRVYRNGGTTPIFTTVAESWPWSLPELRWNDTGRAAGSVNTYRITASDGTATTALSPVSNSATATGSNPPAYASTVLGNTPRTYWRLDEASGPVAGSSASGADGITVGGVTRNQPGAIPSGSSVSLDGTGYLAASSQTTHTGTFSQSAFFRTTTRVGGTIMAYTADQTGPGVNAGTDRVVLMENDGKVVFTMFGQGARGPSLQFVRSTATYRDGLWHQVTATYGAGFMNLYVDGVLQGTTAVATPFATPPGYLRAGYANLGSHYLVFGRNFSGIPAPTSFFFTGSIDEVADFPVELTPAQVTALWSTGAAGLLGAAPPDGVAPSTPGSLGATTTATSVTLTWTASTDNVAVTGYEVRRNGTLITTTGPGTLTYTDNGRTPSTTYNYTVTAIDAASNPSVPASTSATTDAAPVDNEDPSTPGGLAATKTTNSVTLTWNASTDNVGVTGYEVRRDGTLVTTSGPAVLTFTDNGRTPNTTYAYSVTAIDAATNSSDPATLSVTTDPVVSSLFSDTWTAGNGSAWSGSWTTGATTGTVDVQSNAGRLGFNDTAGAFARAQLTGSAAVADSDLVFSYQWSSGAARAYFNAYVRGSAWQNAYRPLNGYGVQVQSDAAAVYLQRNVGGTVTTLATVASGNVIGTGKQWIRLRTVGSNVYLRVWADGTPEPSTWTSTVSDSTVSAAGQTFLSLNRAGVNVGAKDIRVDDLTITAATGP